MRHLWLMLAVLVGSTAFADPKPDLVFVWTEGEMSKDMSIWRTEIMVTGDRLHYTHSYSGRNPLSAPPVNVDAAVKDPKKVAAALTALDKIKVKKAKPLTVEQQMDMRTGCIRRGKMERCASASGKEPDPTELKAILAVRDALLDGVTLPPSL